MTFSANGLNPHTPQPISLGSLLRGILRHRQLIMHMVRREVVGRYKGSILGISWSFFPPGFMFSVYIFAFSIAGYAWFQKTRKSFADVV